MSSKSPRANKMPNIFIPKLSSYTIIGLIVLPNSYDNLNFAAAAGEIRQRLKFIISCTNRTYYRIYK